MRLNPTFLSLDKFLQLPVSMRLLATDPKRILLRDQNPAKPQLQVPSADSPGIQQVRADTEANLNKSVRWGGTVVGVKNLDGETRVEVIAKPLFRDGQPDNRQASEGRFIAVFDQFLDPSDYKKDSAITVVGVVTGSEVGQIGEAQYDFPQVQTTAHQLWQRGNERFARRSQYGYGYGYRGPRYGFHNRGFRRGYGRYGYGNRYALYGGRHHRYSPFYDWWVPGLVWSVYGNHHGYYRGSRVRLNLSVGN